ncbi:hypothetical protein J4E81_007471 [Alternaria sp. BMP 2799]|nr:hypothetical protein J4E81_007471 [Alternaria sp. BMP 2799]
MDNEKDTLPAYTRFSTPKLSWRVPPTSMRTPEQQFELDLEAVKNDGELARIQAESDEETRRIKMDLVFLTIKLLIFTVAAVYILGFVSEVLATRASEVRAVVKATPAAKYCFPEGKCYTQEEIASFVDDYFSEHKEEIDENIDQAIRQAMGL